MKAQVIYSHYGSVNAFTDLFHTEETSFPPLEPTAVCLQIFFSITYHSRAYCAGIGFKPSNSSLT